MSPVLRACRRNNNAAWTGGITLKIVRMKTGRQGQARHQ
jgi:hypothetical protein